MRTTPRRKRRAVGRVPVLAYRRRLLLGPTRHKSCSVMPAQFLSVPRLVLLPCAVLLISFSTVATPLAGLARDIALPPGVEQVTSVEGITEYRLANGLSV